MIVLIKITSLTIILVLSLKIALSENMLLDRFGRYFEKKVDEGHKIFDLFICPFCMGTLLGVAAHAFAFGLNIIPFKWDWQLVVRYPIIVGLCSIISGFTWTIYLTINQIRDNNEAQSQYFKNINNSEQP